MKLTHNVPVHAYRASDPITPEYQAEVDETMRRAEQAWKRGQRRLAKAERTLAKASASRQSTARIAHLEAVVELRRVELEQLHRLMAASQFPAANRGRKSFRPVPQPGGPL